MESISLYDLIDMDMSEFESYCATKNVGYLKSLTNLMTAIYYQCAGYKDEILNRVQKGSLSNDEKTQKTLAGLYSKMMLIEGKISMLKTKTIDKMGVN